MRVFERKDKPHNPNCTRLGFAGGYAPQFFNVGYEQSMFRVNNTESLKLSLSHKNKARPLF